MSVKSNINPKINLDQLKDWSSVSRANSSFPKNQAASQENYDKQSRFVICIAVVFRSEISCMLSDI